MGKKITSKFRKNTSLQPKVTEGENKISQNVTTTPKGTTKRDVPQRKIDYGSFVAKEIVGHVVEQGKQDLKPDELNNFLSISTSFRALSSRHRILLTCNDLLDPKSEKVQFARENHLMIHLKLDNFDDLGKILHLLSNATQDVLSLINSIEVFTFGIDINQKLQKQAKQLLALLFSLPKLLSLNFKNIDDEVNLAFSFPKQLTSISFQIITYESQIVIENAPGLISFYIDSIDYDSEVIFNKTPNLVSGSCGIITNASLTLKNSPNLITFLCETLDTGGSVSLYDAPKLESISFPHIEEGAFITLPNELPNLHSILFDSKDPDIKSQFEILQNSAHQNFLKKQSLHP